jgi:Tfp pilus assembly protein PilO
MRADNRPNAPAGIGDELIQKSLQYGPFLTVAVIAIPCILLGALIYFYLLVDWSETNRVYREQVVKKEKENLRTEKMLEGEEVFQTEFRKIVGLYEEAKPLLPEETEISEVLGQVVVAAQKNGVTLTGLSAVKESVKSPKAEKLYEREIPALVTGPYPQVVRFFSDVARMERILVVRDYSVVSLKNTVSAGFTLVAYHAPPPAEKPPVPANAPGAPKAEVTR